MFLESLNEHLVFSFSRLLSAERRQPEIRLCSQADILPFEKSISYLLGIAILCSVPKTTNSFQQLLVTNILKGLTMCPLRNFERGREKLTVDLPVEN